MSMDQMNDPSYQREYLLPKEASGLSQASKREVLSPQPPLVGTLLIPARISE